MMNTQSLEPDTVAYESMIATVDSLYNIGALNHCLEACEEWIKLCSIEFGPTSIEAWDARSYKGLILMKNSQYPEAEETMEEVLSAVDPDEGEDHQIVYASTLANYADILHSRGKITEALAAQRDVLHMDTLMGYENDSVHAQLLNNMAVSYEIMGDSRTALQYLDKALPISSEKSLPFCNQNMAENYKQLGDFHKSMTYFEKADSLFAHLYGPDHLETMNCRVNYAILRLELGEYGAVIDILTDLEKRARQNTEIQSYHDLHARIQRYLFLAYLYTREYEQAEEYLDKYQQTLALLYYDQPDFRQMAQLQRVRLLEEQGQLVRADKLISTWFDKVDQIEFLDVQVEIYEQYISIKAATGQANEAIRVQENLVNNLQERYGLYGLKLLKAKSNLSRMYYDGQNYERSKKLNLETMESIIHQVSTIYPYLSDNGKLKYKSHTQPVLDFIHRSLIDTFFYDKTYLKRFNEMHQNYTSLAMDYSLIWQNANDVNTTAYDAWNQERKKIEEIYLNNSSGRESLDSLLNLSNEIERRLSAGREMNKGIRNYERFNSQLKDHNSVVQFIAWNAGEADIRYFALIDARGKEPILVACPIDAQSNLSMESDDLYHKVWKRIMPYIPEGNSIYIVPDGALNRVSFYSIRLPESGDYVFEKYKIHILPNLRMMDSFHEDNGHLNDNQSVAVFGNPDYSGSISNPLDPILRTLTELPSAQKEIRSVEHLFKDAGWNVEVHEKREANKTEFARTADYDMTILHIASHGIYQPVKGVESEGLVSRYQKYPAVNPMFQSALYLADAPSDFASSRSTRSGYLSAYEISNMRFHNLKLVTLSTCESGLGTAYASEGVFGLRRGFFLAGAENIVTTLAKIPDGATSVFMHHFYKNLIDGATLFDSFKTTQQYMSVRYPAKVWGAFVLIGRGDYMISGSQSPFRWWYLAILLVFLLFSIYWLRSPLRSSARSAR